MPRPVHFEIHASEPERARRFYETVFGWQFQQWGDQPYWVIRTGDSQPGIDGGMLPRQGPPPASDGPVNASPLTMGVDDLDAYLARALEAGGTLALPRQGVPKIGWLAYVKDTEGNLFGILEPDENAA